MLKAENMIISSIFRSETTYFVLYCRRIFTPADSESGWPRVPGEASFYQKSPGCKPHYFLNWQILLTIAPPPFNDIRLISFWFPCKIQSIYNFCNSESPSPLPGYLWRLYANFLPIWVLFETAISEQWRTSLKYAKLDPAWHRPTCWYTGGLEVSECSINMWIAVGRVYVCMYLPC